MNKELQSLFELSRDPMVAITDSKIVSYNSPAAELFGITAQQTSAIGLVPDHLLNSGSERFVASACIGGANFAASAATVGDMLVISLSPLNAQPSSNDFITEPLMNGMRSSLFNTGLAIDRVAASIKDKSNPKLKEYLSILYHSYYSMRRIMGDVNASIAMNDGTIDFSPQPTDLARLCSELVSTVSFLLSERGIELQFSTTLGELIANVDSEKIERLLINLLVNSFTHTPKGGTIKVGLQSTSGSAVISVEDSGTGIPSGELKNVFTSFEKPIDASDLCATATPGLGINISRGIAELHHGALLIESRENVGTCVRIILPIGDDSLGRFTSARPQYRTSGMSLVLTGLSGLLPSSFYTSKYMD